MRYPVPAAQATPHRPGVHYGKSALPNLEHGKAQANTQTVREGLAMYCVKPTIFVNVAVPD